MSAFHTVITTVVCTLSVAAIPFLRPSKWDRWGAGNVAFDEYRCDSADHEPHETNDPHWNSIEAMLDSSSDPHTTLGFSEVRSLAAQYLAAYVDEDHERMALISAAGTPEQLLHGMTYVAHTHACVVAYHDDGDIHRVVRRDCESAIARLYSADA